MKPNLLFAAALTALSFCFFNLKAQDNATDDENNSAGIFKGAEGFHAGFYLGAFFPNKNSTVVYDGYGYDASGNKKDFASSYMYQKIVIENDPNNTAYTD